MWWLRFASRAATLEGEVLLVLIRRVGESLMIGSTVTVTVLGLRGGQIRLGVQAPRALPVHRAEVFARIQREGVVSAPNMGMTRESTSSSEAPRAGSAALPKLPEDRT